MQCKNCEAIIESHFCPECGQKTYTERFTVKQIWKDTLESLTNLDKGFFKTTWMMVQKPGILIEEYLGGKTLYYTKPIQFLLVCIGIYIFIISLTGGFESLGVGYIGGMYKSMGLAYTKEQMEMQKRNMSFMMDYFSLIYLLILPFFSLGTYLVFKKKGYNYAENLIINCYVYGTICLASLFWLFVVRGFPALGQHTMSFSFLTTILLLTLMYRKIYFESWGKSILKSVLSFILGYFAFFAFMMIVVIIGVALVILFKKIF